MKWSARHCLISVLSVLSIGLAVGCECEDDPTDETCTNGVDECDENAAPRCSTYGTSQLCTRNESHCLTWQDQPQNFLNCLPVQCTESCIEGALQCSANHKTQMCQSLGNGCNGWIDNAVDLLNCCQDACTLGNTQCNGKDIQTCVKGASGCTEWTVSQTCPVACQNAQCSECAGTCTLDTYSCNGKTLQKCVKSGNCNTWVNQKTCSAYCKAQEGICTDDLPPCKLKPGSKATILQWTDGDTLWVRAKTDGTCNDYEYDSESKQWKNIRFDIRVEGIDAPECDKERNTYGYYTCIKNTSYDCDNEPMGYEAWDAAQKMLPYQSVVTISCEKTQTDGSCGFDTTKKRNLAYIGYEKNNASYDFATELARQGYAFANIEFAQSTSKIGQICAAQKEAINAKIGLWSLASTVDGVLNKMCTAKGGKKQNLKGLESKCNNLIK